MVGDSSLDLERFEGFRQGDLGVRTRIKPSNGPIWVSCPPEVKHVLKLCPERAGGEDLEETTSWTHIERRNGIIVLSRTKVRKTLLMAIALIILVSKANAQSRTSSIKSVESRSVARTMNS